MAKAFAWSYSRYKAYDTCPKRYYECDVAKNYTDSSEQLVWGSEVHEALQDATTGKRPLPESMQDYQHWVDEITAGKFTREAEMPPWTRHVAGPHRTVEVDQQ